MRILVLVFALLGAALWVLAQPPNPPDFQRVAVIQILATIDPAKPETLSAAEEALVKRGDAAVPALQTTLGEQQTALAVAVKQEARDYQQEQKLQQCINALDSAIIRLTWKLHPRELINQWVQKNVKGFDGKPFTLEQRPARVMDDPVARTFPNQLFYTVIIRQYPVARILPEPLGAHNIFVIGKDGGVQLITDFGQLNSYFQRTVPQVKPGNSPEAEHDAVYSWLRMAEVMVQDGMFAFDPITDITVTPANNGDLATGKVTITRKGGNAGSISVTIAFDIDGKPVRIDDAEHIEIGIRPICQATKLLDPDPIVRRMAEQDLLVMGSAAEFYVMEQRAKATPELQTAIDALWARILREHR